MDAIVANILERLPALPPRVGSGRPHLIKIRTAETRTGLRHTHDLACEHPHRCGCDRAMSGNRAEDHRDDKRRTAANKREAQRKVTT